MVKYQVLSPAKINLMLRILSKRADGYHNLQTHFQILNWGDQMSFEQTKIQGNNRLEISGFSNLANEDNLIFKAARLIQPWAQNNSDWQVTVDKQIPLGSGLGGGSSNAATTLKFLNKQWQCDLSTFDLLALATKLGADVPIFIMGHGAMGTGIGDVLTPITFHTPYILLLFPACQVNTAQLFKASDLIRNQSQLDSGSLQEQSFWLNDFFPVVLRQFPEINHLYQRLKDQIELKLSGTGSTLFALFDDEHMAQEACQKASQECRSIIVEPLL